MLYSSPSRIFLSAFVLLSLPPSFAPAAEQEAARDPLKVTITGGSWETIRRLPGAAYIIREEELEKKHATDVSRVLKEVPGVNVQEEDGYGLRPNIGMRGGRVDRSADITLMEDGVLIAPAPYAAPEAYYFPRIDRMETVETRKGSGSIKFGPRTTNGALNLISSSIPAGPEAEALAGAGRFGEKRASTHAGNAWKHFGYVVDASHHESTGFKKLDFIGGNTGFDIQDFMGKFRLNNDPADEHYQEFEFKFGLTDELSRETYLGLTDADFRATPTRRYAASQKDEMDSRHQQLQFRHYAEPLAGMNVTSTLYRNDFQRNWYKLDSVTAGGTRRNIADILNSPGTFASHMAILRGGDSAANALRVRNNNREYYAQGAQSDASYNYRVGAVENRLEFGLRYHYDEQDRFQHDDDYRMTGGVMRLTSRGAPGSESNRIGEARAWAGYILNRFAWGHLGITPGLRYEHIGLKTSNFGTSDPGRTGANLQVFKSNIEAWIPGIGADYALTDRLTLVAGVHKGFAPPEPAASAAAAADAREEESVNYEAGMRYEQSALRAELIGFLTHYDNLLGADTFSSGGSGGDQFNGGEVKVHGIESTAAYDFAPLLGLKSLRLPARASYTWTRAEFRSSFNSTFAEWGNVTRGDELPYIPRHQLYASLGVGADKWDIALSGKFTDEMRTVSGKGPIPELRATDRSFVLDLTGEYELAEGVRAFGSVNNLLDDVYVAARRPAGVRPGMPRSFFAGLKVKF